MANKYGFSGFYGASEDPDAVECPELDALVRDLEHLCDRHGVRFELEDGYDTTAKITLQPYSRDELALDFLRHLEEASKEIPWIAKAKTAYEAKRHDRLEREEQSKRADALARQLRHTREAQEAKQAREQHMVQHGVEIGGVHYKLVKED